MKLSHIFTWMLGVVLLAACTQNFEEINTNPNAPESVDAQFLLPHVIKTLADDMASNGWESGNLLAQLTTKHDFNDVDRYDLKTNTELWNASYFRLRDLETIISQSEAEGGNPAYKGVALVLRAYIAANLTDLWGSIPYSEALKGAEGSFQPTYDTQEEVYTGANGILASLEEANTLLGQGGLPIGGDILFNGDLSMWQKLANSLRVRYLLRVSAVYPQAAAELQSIVDNDPLMEGNDDNAALPYLASAPNQWYVFNTRQGDYENVRMSTTIDTVLQMTLANSAGDADPRLYDLFKPTAATKDQPVKLYIGLPNGLSASSKSSYVLNEISTLGARFRDIPNGVEAQFMMYAELQFALAEAAQKGMISGEASMYYANGVAAAFEYLGVEMPADYMSREGVAFAGQELEVIMLQKWLASFGNGYEGWYEYRRTGMPALRPSVDNLNGDLIPVRYIYPTDEQAVNLDNYTSAVSELGADDYNTKSWWDM
ncbi:SusD/RagB family nutrient-binding outer membrane lipoprotein [Pontibacter sp. G13]|uniref:SusD/RagB family nutrient-binding outer membrane lipoprotein n=1 Tax=Pontibacter sp. G13 TaxID=3074898 RepID=UPI00288AC620|nr:SusD/RagB family nutrient-binding outer membrane lipoprotein [Pontibacter sp. G13]WNJ20551.1 SusD/RagB family nutrient-binding outer membrane lipoprotein [Pontibacter sp. G13]